MLPLTSYMPLSNLLSLEQTFSDNVMKYLYATPFVGSVICFAKYVYKKNERSLTRTESEQAILERIRACKNNCKAATISSVIGIVGSQILLWLPATAPELITTSIGLTLLELAVSPIIMLTGLHAFSEQANGA